jgi:hypothetical protein
VTGGGLSVCVEPFAVSNGVGGFWAKPVVCGDVDFDESSDCSASIADEAAPRASNMAELRQMGRGPAAYFHGIRISKPRATAKKPMK